MNEIVLFTGLLLGNLTITSYQSIPKQTDLTPFYTSTGERVHKGGVAVSRDLLCKACKKLHRRCRESDKLSGVHYGDYIYIEKHGIFTVNDCMGATKYDKRLKKRFPITKAFDIWVSSLKEESAIKVQHQNVFLINRRIYEKSIQKN